MLFSRLISTVSARVLVAQIQDRELYPEKPEIGCIDNYDQGALSMMLRKVSTDDYSSNLMESTALLISRQNITYECFREAIYTSFFCIEKGMTLGTNPQTDVVIKHIHEAGKQINATQEQLIQFTAIAMHNMYGLSKFTGDVNDKSNWRSRGLMQYTGEEVASNFRKNTGYFLYQLDEFSLSSIKLEFGFFIQTYFVPDHSQCSDIKCLQFKAFINTTLNMGSNEAIALVDFMNRKCVCTDVEMVNNEYALKWIRRARYYCKLQYYIAKNCRKPVIIVKE